MGIRTLLRRTASGVALPPVPAFEAAASTVRVPVTFTSALRHATADLRQSLATRRRRPTGSADTGALTAATVLPGAADLPAALALADGEALAALTGVVDGDALAALTGVMDRDALAALTGLTGTDALAALSGVIGADNTLTVADLSALTGNGPTDARPPCNPDTPGKPSRRWARLARDYLALVLTLLPRPRPAHTTITVYITTDSTLSERPGGSAPSRRQGPDRWGPEPDGAP
ncbi:hypothetical protein ACFY9S_14215 [Streptomyces sp. NPDC012474]|uniref:hypothetical protein n=1 Tax=Streptomyces sp. NPDC012474 TaxID=3364836 RepID=UPI0036E8D6D3